MEGSEMEDIWGLTEANLNDMNLFNIWICDKSLIVWVSASALRTHASRHFLDEAVDLHPQLVPYLLHDQRQHLLSLHLVWNVIHQFLDLLAENF